MKPFRISFPLFNPIDHAKVPDTFGGGLTYIADFCVWGQSVPSSVYHAANPDVSKGHKEYMSLTFQYEQMYVSGGDAKRMEEYRRQAAIHCLKCNEVIYSLHRHDCRSCECEAVFIDGGREYTRIGGDPTDYDSGDIDFLTKTFIPTVINI